MYTAVCADSAAAPSFSRLFGNASSIGDAAVEFDEGPFGVNGRRRHCKMLVVCISFVRQIKVSEKNKKINLITTLYCARHNEYHYHYYYIIICKSTARRHSWNLCRAFIRRKICIIIIVMLNTSCEHGEREKLRI